MRLETSVLRSRFGRRLLALFILCALVPTVLVAFLSLRDVSRYLDQNAREQLHEYSKSVGFGILQRLQLLESQLSALPLGFRLAERGNSAVPQHLEQHLREQFLSVRWSASAILGPAETERLRGGGTLLTSTVHEGTLPTIRLIRRIDPAEESRGLLVAVVNPDFLWGLPNRTGLPPGLDYTVLDPSGLTLYHSGTVSPAFAVRTVQEASRISTGDFTWGTGTGASLASYWSLFLKTTFGTDRLIVVVSRPAAEVRAPVAGFRRGFLPVILLSLLMVGALSLRQIRRSLLPLQALQKGTRRIAEQDFESRVQVTSGDEFQELATDFNSMAARLGRQFTELGQIVEGLREQIQERELAERALRESEQQLRHAQKMDAVGTLAGGVAHDFNNLLTVIVSYTELALATLDQENPLREDLRQVAEAADRATGLTRQLLAFSRKQVLEPQVLEVNELVGGMEKMLRRLIGEHIEVCTVRGVPEAWIHADRGQMDQVLMNLAVNARDAMPEGGTLTISTALVLLKQEEAAGLGILAGPCVVISVQDTGTGMDEATRARIFEPFFTTKAPGKGTGLGLSTVYGIVQQSSGAVSLESELGAGTRFKIYLPAIQPAERQQSKDLTAPAGSSGGETVLLVEDEAPVRILSQRILEEAGYQVISANDGEEALALAQRYEGRIHLLLTDVVMPQMGGKRLAANLQPRRPELRVLYMSGYTDAGSLGEDLSGRPIELLQKPFLPKQLTQRVRDILDGTLDQRRERSGRTMTFAGRKTS